MRTRISTVYTIGVDARLYVFTSNAAAATATHERHPSCQPCSHITRYTSYRQLILTRTYRRPDTMDDHPVAVTHCTLTRVGQIIVRCILY